MANQRSSDMQNQTYLFKRGTVYYFRIKIPVDLAWHYSSKKEIKSSLKTQDRQEAVRRMRAALAKAESDFEYARQLNAKATGDLPPI